MITSLIAGLSVLLLTGITNSYISYWLFIEPENHDREKSS